MVIRCKNSEEMLIIKVKTINDSVKQNLVKNHSNNDRLFWRKGRIIRQEDRYDEKYSDTSVFVYNSNLLTKSITNSGKNSPILL
jgi:hypothetical protein